MKSYLRNRLNINGDSLLGHSSVYLTSNILNAAIPFLLLPVLTRYLSPAEYGVIGMFHMVLAVLGAFTGLSVHGAANRKYYDQDDGVDLPAYIASCVQIVVVTTCITLVVVYFLRDHLYEWTGISPQWLLIAVLVSGTSYFSYLRLGQWQVRSASFSYGIFQVTQSLLNMGLSLWLVVAMLGGLEGRLWGQSLTPILFGMVALFFLYRTDLLKLSWRPDYIGSALSFGVPLIPHIAGIFMLSMLDRVIIKQFLGLEQIGIYMIAIQLAMAMGIIADAFHKAYVPWLYERLKANDHETKRRIVFGTYVYFLSALLIALLIAIVAPWFVPWFAGVKYVASGTVLGWLALGQAFNGMYLMVAGYIFYSQRTGMLSVTTLVSGSLHLFLVYILVQAYGIEGAAIAYAISMGIRFILTWVIAQHQHPMPWFSPGYI